MRIMDAAPSIKKEPLAVKDKNYFLVKMVRLRGLLLLFMYYGVQILVRGQQEGDVRLINDRDGISVCGRVEIFHSGQWGTVCDDRWNLANGNVVCKQLGYSSAERVFYTAHYGRGTGPIWLDSVQCREGQNSLSECTHGGWGVHDCSHSEDAGVCCQREQATKPDAILARLRCPDCNIGGACKACPDKVSPDPSYCFPRTVVQGIVEVHVNGEWGMISEDGWGWNEATVLCGQLGYPMAMFGQFTQTMSRLWPSYESETPRERNQCSNKNLKKTRALRNEFNRTILQSVDCHGRESKLQECFIGSIGFKSNPTKRVAVVKCAFFPHPNCYRSFGDKYRLRSGATPWSGRVETMINNVWGTVCDTGFDIKAGNVVCRKLGYGTVKKILGRASYGRGIGPIHFTQLRCTGQEFTLRRCPHQTGNTALACTHGGDVGVECHVPNVTQCSIYSQQRNNVRLHTEVDPQNPRIKRYYPEVKGSAGWGMLCYNESSPAVDLRVGEVICRQTQGMFLSRVSRGGRSAGFSGRAFYNGTIKCQGNETRVSECSVNLKPAGWCPGMYTMIDCTNGVPDLVPDLARFHGSLQSRRYVDRIPMYYLSCALEEGCLSSSAVGAPRDNTRYLLRFDSLTMNWGLHDFLPVLPRNEWIWHSCHNHYHSMEAFVQYDLLNATTGVKVAEGHKASFCLEDSTCARGYSGHFRCYLGIQGISINCGDLYASYLDCQWIDITGVRGGEYIIRHRVNPDRLVVESDYKNNEASCRITLNSDLTLLTVQQCWLSDHEGSVIQ